MMNSFQKLSVLSKIAVNGAMLHKYKLKRRQFIAGYAFLTALIIASTAVLQVYLQIKPVNYNLSSAAKALVGDSRDDTKDYLKQNKDQTAYEFSVPQAAGGSELAEHTGRVVDAYSVTLPTRANNGITVTDTQSKIAVTLTPDFHVGSVQKVDGDHIVYPMGSKKLVYTLKYNGLKEDIIVPEFQGNNLDFSFKLTLPSGVEARQDAVGDIGIYSSDPTLFGNISFGSNEDRAKVDKARENSQKTNLVMTIPAPIVKDAKGTEHTDKAAFSLSEKSTKQTKDTGPEQAKLPANLPRSLVTSNQYDLTIQSKNLKDLAYPIAIDPTMQVLGAGNFDSITNEGGVTNETTQIKRSSLTGGALGTWSGTGTSMLGSEGHELVVYKGFIYAIGHVSSGIAINRVQFATISSTGVIGTWSASITQLSAAKGVLTAEVYNGRIYIMGGLASGYNHINVVQSIGIKTDGTGTLEPSWTTLSSTGLGNRSSHTSFMASGYLYILGGCTASTFGVCNGNVTNTTYYARINADGSLASDSDGVGGCLTTWCSTGATLNVGVHSAGAAYYNGYIYIVGGANDAGANQSVVQYAKVNANGTLGTFYTTASYPLVSSQPGQSASVVATGGYLYVMGGQFASSHTNINRYAQINADGSLGTGISASTWFDNPTLGNGAPNSGRTAGAAVAHNDYIVIVGGNNGSGPTATAERAQMNSAGSLHNGAWCTNTTPPCSATTLAGAARYAAATTVYSGYIYVVGGCIRLLVTSTACLPQATVDYAPINADGSLGTWLAGPDILQPGGGGRAYTALVAHSGYLYLFGGCVTGLGGGTGCLTITSNSQSSLIGTTGLPGAWSTEAATGLPSISAHSAFVYNGKAYLSGGCLNAGGNTCLSPSAIVYTADLLGGAAGSRLGNWSDTTINLPTGRAMSRVIVEGNRVYMSGGWNAGILDDIIYSSFNSSGVLQPWQATTDLPAATMGHGFGVSNGYLYVYGGCTASSHPADCSTTVANTYYAKINANGTVGNGVPAQTWLSTTSMAAARRDFSAVVYGSVVYALAGTPGSPTSYLNTTTYQTINNGGSGKLTGWSVASGTGATSRFGHASFVYSGYLYITGGCTDFTQFGTAYCGAVRTDMLRASIGANGNLGNWVATSTGMPPTGGGRFMYHSMAVYKDKLYMTGGALVQDSIPIQNFTSQATTYVIALDSSTGNTNGGWTTLISSPLSFARGGMGSTVYNGRWYLAGGCTTPVSSSCVTDTAVAAFEPAGVAATLSAWAPQPALSSTRGRPGLEAYNGRLYVIGGNTSTNSVEVAGINTANGTVGSWVSNPSSTDPIGGAAVYGAYNGYLYSVAGWDTVTEKRTSTRFAPILANGEVGPWQSAGQDSSAKLTQKRILGAGLIYNGRMYINGGFSPDTIFDDDPINNPCCHAVTFHSSTEYATLQSIPRTGSFSKRYDFDVGVRPTKLITRGTKRVGATVDVSYANNNNAGGTYGSTTSTANIAYGGSGALNIALGSSVTLSRYLYVRYAMDDSYSAVFPDDGNELTITDFDLYYTSNAARRLRNGRTFTTGNDGKPGDRGLEASPQ